MIRIVKKSPISDLKASLQFGKKVKAPSVRTYELTHILLQSIFDNILDPNHWKDKHSIPSEEDVFLIDNNVTSTSDC